MLCRGHCGPLPLCAAVTAPPLIRTHLLPFLSFLPENENLYVISLWPCGRGVPLVLLVVPARPPSIPSFDTIPQNRMPPSAGSLYSISSHRNDGQAGSISFAFALLLPILSAVHVTFSTLHLTQVDTFVFVYRPRAASLSHHLSRPLSLSPPRSPSLC